MGRKRKEPREKTFDVVVGTLIADARLTKKWSMSRLANDLGMSRQLLYAYETGALGCPLIVLVSIAQVMGIEITALIPMSHKNLQTLQSRQKAIK